MARDRRIKFNQHNSIYLVLVVLCLSAFLYSPRFFRIENINLMLRQTAALGILTLGHVFVISCGCVDLSLTATMQMSIAMLMVVVKSYGEGLLIVGLLLSLVVTFAIGLINGLIVAKFYVQPFLSTLFIGAIITGVRKVATGVTPLGTPPKIIIDLVKGGSILSYSNLWLLFATVISYIVLNKTVFGRQTMMVGTNSAAAMFSGIRTTRVVIASYCISAFAAMIAGIVSIGYLGFADQTSIGNGMEMSSLVAAVLGGNLLSGGRASVSGALGGAVAMTLMLNIVILFGLEIQYQHVLRGVVLLAVVILSAQLRK